MSEEMPRKAKDIAGTEREWTPAEMYQLYFRGFRDGAGITAMRHSGLPPYDRGYRDGKKARADACAVFAKEISYRPSILRVVAAKQNP